MDDQIAQFVSITGLDSERAKFYIESAGGDVETALSTFYESEGAQDDQGVEETMSSEPSDPAPTPIVDSTGPRTLSGAPAPSAPANWATNAATSSSARKPGGGFSAAGGRGGIATLRDMQSSGQGNQGGDSDDDEEEEDDDSKGPANFYTGGERSGLNVQNPNRGDRGDKAPDVVQDILKKAAEGSRSRAAEGGPSTRGAAAPAPSFTGTGRTINDPASTPSDEGAAAGASGRALSRSEALEALRANPFGPGGMMGDNEDDEDEGDVAERRITFWQDGFSIADGPLCHYDDPQHAQTLAQIKNNTAPLHLLNVRFGQQVQLTVEKKLNEKYKAPPPKPMKAFSGSGNRLGAPVPTMTGASSSSTSATSQAAPTTSAPEPSSMFQVDASQPTTQIQIRLGDGQRMVAKFNHTHTVADIRRYINASHPGMTSREYTLQSSFPPKPLTDEEQSLTDAGLINSVVIQKWA